MDAKELYYWLNITTLLQVKGGLARKYPSEYDDFVILNLELKNGGGQDLYGIVITNNDDKPSKFLQRWPWNLVDLMTADQIWKRFKIDYDALPEPAREGQHFRRKLAEIDEKFYEKRLKLTVKDMKMFGNSRRNGKGIKCFGWHKFESDTEEKEMMKWWIIHEWKKRQKSDVRMEELIPILSCDKHGTRNIDWCLLVNIEMLGYYVGFIFRIKNDMFQFKKVMMDWEEIEAVHRLLGTTLIAQLKNLLRLPVSYGDRLAALRKRCTKRSDECIRKSVHDKVLNFRIELNKIANADLKKSIKDAKRRSDRVFEKKKVSQVTVAKEFESKTGFRLNVGAQEFVPKGGVAMKGEELREGEDSMDSIDYFESESINDDEIIDIVDNDIDELLRFGITLQDIDDFVLDLE